MSGRPDTDASAHSDAPMRALAALLPCGVLLLGADGTPRFASARACALVGVADDAQLRARWNALGPALGLASAGLPRGAQPLRAGGTVDVDDGPRALCAEVHATGEQGDGQWLVLLQRRDRADGSDDALIAAGRADAYEHVLAGLLHDLNGPLNNLNLTLALLSGTLARITAQQPDDPALERCRRYVDTLGTETRRFCDCARAMSAAVTPAEQSVGIVQVSALLNDVRHALRHHASLNELRVTVAPADAGLCVAGDVELLRLALVDLMLTAIDATAAGGEIMVTPEANGSTMRLRIAAHAARAPADALRTADGILVSPRAQWVCYVAARRIIETHGGSAALHADAGDMLVMDVRMPLARA